MLGKAADKAAFITNCLSFLTGFAAWWRPARVMEVVHREEAPVPGSTEKRFRKYFSLAPDDEMTSAVVDDEWVTRSLAPFIRVLWNLESTDLRRVLLTAVSWQAHANSTDGLGRYLHYFASVELVAHFLYGALPDDVVGRVPPSEVQRKVLELLLDVNSKNYMPTVTKIAEALEVSARTKLKRIATLVDFDAECSSLVRSETERASSTSGTTSRTATSRATIARTWKQTGRRSRSSDLRRQNLFTESQQRSRPVRFSFPPQRRSGGRFRCLSANTCGPGDGLSSLIVADATSCGRPEATTE